MNVQARLSDPEWSAPSESLFFRPINNIGWIKPSSGGLWTSTYLGPESISGWAEWCRVEEFACGTKHLWLLTPKADANIIEIDSESDLFRLLARPEQRAYRERIDLPFRDSNFGAWIDFEALVEMGVDGIHLTEDGQWTTRFSRPGLYGWDSESTCWLRWAFDNVEDGGLVEIGDKNTESGLTESEEADLGQC